MRVPLRILIAVAASGLLSGCLSGLGLGTPQGVLPAGEVAPPPPLRGTAAGRSLAARAEEREAEAVPPARASRSLSVPSTARGAGAISAPSERRIRREELEDNGAGPSGSGPSLSPSITPSGGVGVGGRF